MHTEEYQKKLDIAHAWKVSNPLNNVQYSSDFYIITGNKGIKIP